MKSARMAAAFMMIVAPSGVAFGQPASKRNSEPSPFGVLASVEAPGGSGARVGSLKFPMSLPPQPEAASPLDPAIFDPRPMWPTPVVAENAVTEPDATAVKDVQVGAVITARY